MKVAGKSKKNEQKTKTRRKLKKRKKLRGVKKNVLKVEKLPNVKKWDEKKK